MKKSQILKMFNKYRITIISILIFGIIIWIAYLILNSIGVPEFKNKWKQVCEHNYCNFSEYGYYETAEQNQPNKENCFIFGDCMDLNYTYITRNVIITSSKRCYQSSSDKVLVGNVEILTRNGDKYFASEININDKNILIPGNVKIYRKNKIENLNNVALRDFFPFYNNIFLRLFSEYKNFKVHKDSYEYYSLNAYRSHKFCENNDKIIYRETDNENKKKNTSVETENSKNRGYYYSPNTNNNSNKKDRNQLEEEFSSDHVSEYEREILEDYDSIDSGETPYDGDDGY